MMGDAQLSWRTVFPGDWQQGDSGFIWSESLKGGDCHVADVRGWGYLTGKGEGALGLSPDTASRIQHEVGALLSAAPDLYEALSELVEVCAPNIYPQPDKPDSAWAKLERARAALSKAGGQS